ncbi:hypothetical protein U4Q19_23225 [Klebsiella pneumoniae]|uniref:hypothetical protein n=1 Tax=Klebsiella TaxID=570 RepID=UPI0007CC569F|nr:MULTISPECIES: hypothetical protein [Klebsiella]MCD5737755.1 hypothetical protein [Klebsiella pneumoniae]MCM6246992.1 hypothetical protein [Klebsiella pneumoniae]MCP5783617.1 hypothetical protein [Klebsiella pneumoniae]MCQ0510343.1 hypothetical protein [Klebsiella pneumoniae]MDB7847633.1 hypothetical protein [Klebsiella pneumoniae]
MTSKLTREQLHERARENVKALKMASRQTAFESAREEILADLQLAELALAAMDGEPVAEVLSNRPGNDTSTIDRALPVGTQLYRHAQQPVVPEEATSDSIEILASARRRDHAVFQWGEDQRNAAADSWNACRATMLQASPVCTCPSGDGSLRWPCPVHPGNSPAIPDSARDALEKALAAMEFMGDTLNNLDAVCTEDVELVAPAFDAVRNVLAAAQQE